MEMMLRDVEGKLDKEMDEAKLRRDQLLMYAILGDPATHLRLPQPLSGEPATNRDGLALASHPAVRAARLDVGFRKVAGFRDFGDARAHRRRQVAKGF